jgi:hypothetical protein
VNGPGKREYAAKVSPNWGPQGLQANFGSPEPSYRSTDGLNHPVHGDSTVAQAQLLNAGEVATVMSARAWGISRGGISRTA